MLVLIAWCQVVGMLGPLLGLIAVVVILLSPSVKGLPLALAGIVIGLGLQIAVWVAAGRVFEAALERPREFMVAIQDRDWTAALATSAAGRPRPVMRNWRPSPTPSRAATAGSPTGSRVSRLRARSRTRPPDSFPWSSTSRPPAVSR